jgi:hypothetical protein
MIFKKKQHCEETACYRRSQTVVWSRLYDERSSGENVPFGIASAVA